MELRTKSSSIIFCTTAIYPEFSMHDLDNQKIMNGIMYKEQFYYFLYHSHLSRALHTWPWQQKFMRDTVDIIIYIQYLETSKCSCKMRWELCLHAYQLGWSWNKDSEDKKVWCLFHVCSFLSKLYHTIEYMFFYQWTMFSVNEIVVGMPNRYFVCTCDIWMYFSPFTF